MRGISTVIVIILIFMIVVVLASLAYVWFSSVIAGLTETGEERIEQVGTTMTSSMTIEGVTANYTYIRNTGSNNITNFSVFVNGLPANTTVPDSLMPGEVGTITFSTPLDPGTYIIKVTGAYAEVEGEYTIEEPEVSGPPKYEYITVCKSGDCNSTTVQGGLRMAHSGDKVKIIDSETYNEYNLRFPEGSIILDCSGASLNGLSNQKGIDISGRTDLTIKNCIFSNYGYCIYGSSASANSINNNIFNNPVYYSIFLRDSSTENKIFDNNIVSSGFGAIALYTNSHKNEITNNNIKFSKYGIYILQCDENEIVDNDISSSAASGILIWLSTNNNITNNKICYSGSYDVHCIPGQTGTGNIARMVSCLGIEYENLC